MIRLDRTVSPCIAALVVGHVDPHGNRRIRDRLRHLSIVQQCVWFIDGNSTIGITTHHFTDGLDRLWLRGDTQFQPVLGHLASAFLSNFVVSRRSRTSTDIGITIMSRFTDSRASVWPARVTGCALHGIIAATEAHVACRVGSRGRLRRLDPILLMILLSMRRFRRNIWRRGPACPLILMP